MPLSKEAEEYLECFSKFEYALMEAGFYSQDSKCDACNRQGFLACDWNKFKTEKLTDLTLKQLKGLSEEARYLIANPPRKRVLNAEGQVTWSNNIPINSLSDAIDACKRVRNNLIHGGKYNDEAASRNQKLLKGATKIINEIVGYDDDVKDHYAEAYFAC